MKEPSVSKFRMTYPNSFVKVGYRIIASSVPTEADNRTSRIICSKSIEESSFASNTIRTCFDCVDNNCERQNKY